MAIKSLPKADVEKLIANLEKSYIKVNEISKEPKFGSEYTALGYAEATISYVIKQLKGEYPI